MKYHIRRPQTNLLYREEEAHALSNTRQQERN